MREQNRGIERESAGDKVRESEPKRKEKGVRGRGRALDLASPLTL